MRTVATTTDLNFRGERVHIGTIRILGTDAVDRSLRKYAAICTRTKRSEQYPLTVSVTSTTDEAEKALLKEYRSYGLDAPLV